MDQVSLMALSMRLEAGSCVKISHEAIKEAAAGDLSSRLFDSVRDSDIVEFVRKIEKNWGITLTRNYERDEWSLYKNPTNKINNERLHHTV